MFLDAKKYKKGSQHSILQELRDVDEDRHHKYIINSFLSLLIMLEEKSLVK